MRHGQFVASMIQAMLLAARKWQLVAMVYHKQTLEILPLSVSEWQWVGPTMYLLSNYRLWSEGDNVLGTWNVSQGRRSMVKVKFQKSRFYFKVKGHGSRSKFGVKVNVKGRGQISGAQQSILVARLCQVQQRATPQVWSWEKSLPVQSVCLCVCNQWGYADNCADAVNRLLIL